jgi:hypothetical protein
VRAVTEGAAPRIQDSIKAVHSLAMTTKSVNSNLSEPNDGLVLLSQDMPGRAHPTREKVIVIVYICKMQLDHELLP